MLTNCKELSKAWSNWNNRKKNRQTMKGQDTTQHS